MSVMFCRSMLLSFDHEINVTRFRRLPCCPGFVNWWIAYMCFREIMNSGSKQIFTFSQRKGRCRSPCQLFDNNLSVLVFSNEGSRLPEWTRVSTQSAGHLGYFPPSSNNSGIAEPYSDNMPCPGSWIVHHCTSVKLWLYGSAIMNVKLHAIWENKKKRMFAIALSKILHISLIVWINTFPFFTKAVLKN